MAKGWLHQLMNYIAFGASYWQYSKWKDELWSIYGTEHRQFRHDDYIKQVEQLKERGLLEASERASNVHDFVERIVKKIPEGTRVSEKQQSGIAHEYIDETWSGLSPLERQGWASAFRDVVLNPAKYPNLFMPKDLTNFLTDKDWRNLQNYVAERSIEELA